MIKIVIYLDDLDRDLSDVYRIYSRWCTVDRDCVLCVNLFLITPRFVFRCYVYFSLLIYVS